MKRDGHQQSGSSSSTAALRFCNCRAPWTSSSSSTSDYTADLQWPSQPLTGTVNSRGSACCWKCGRARPAAATSRRRFAPVPKSKGKVKGARKVRSCDVSLNHRLVSWRVVDRGVDGMVRAGVSASGIVSYLAGEHRDEDYDGGECDEEMEVAGAVAASDCYGGVFDMGRGVGEDEAEEGSPGGGEPTGAGTDEADSCGGIGFGETDDMGFYQVGFVWDYVDDDDWCIVGEL